MEKGSCRICARKDSRPIDAALRNGRSINDIASIYQINSKSLRNHAAHTKGSRPAPERSGELMPVMPPELENEAMDPRERAEKMCNYLQKRIGWATREQMANKDLAPISTQLSTWTKILAKLRGDYEVTEAQVYKHPAMAKAVEGLMTLFADDPIGLAKIERWGAYLAGEIPAP